MEENKIEEKLKYIREGKRDFPVSTLKRAEEVLRTIKSAGGRISSKAISEAMGIRGGGLSRLIASAKRWGLISGSGTLIITELGKRILHPISENELLDARTDAFTNVKLFKKLYERFGGNIPKDSTFVAILIREYEIKEKDAKTILNIYKDSLKNFLRSTENKIISSVSFSSSPENKGRDRLTQTDNSGVSIIIDAPSGKFNLYAKNKKEFKDIIDNKLKKVWEAIEILWAEIPKDANEETKTNHANPNSEDVLDNAEEK
ncbi:MAG TPA: hypothetical protein ENI22_00800 [Candidatus Pacearchaeota archaeon]|nr:hypothetical protein [Candidatus Pacearchaeota archaeon]